MIVSDRIYELMKKKGQTCRGRIDAADARSQFRSSFNRWLGVLYSFVLADYMKEFFKPKRGLRTFVG